MFKINVFIQTGIYNITSFGYDDENDKLKHFIFNIKKVNYRKINRFKYENN